jgi:hypothetical protein
VLPRSRLTFFRLLGLHLFIPQGLSPYVHHPRAQHHVRASLVTVNINATSKSKFRRTAPRYRPDCLSATDSSVFYFRAREKLSLRLCAHTAGGAHGYTHDCRAASEMLFFYQTRRFHLVPSPIDLLYFGQRPWKAFHGTR